VHYEPPPRFRNSSGRDRGRTFYSRRGQHHPSESSTNNAKCQKTSTRDFSDQHVDSNYDNNWRDRQTNGRAHAYNERLDQNTSFQNNWREQNGSRRNNNSRGSRSRAHNYYRQQSRTNSTDVSDRESDPWPPASIESNSVCSSGSLSSEVVPLSLNAGEGWCPFDK